MKMLFWMMTIVISLIVIHKDWGAIAPHALEIHATLVNAYERAAGNVERRPAHHPIPQTISPHVEMVVQKKSDEATRKVTNTKADLTEEALIHRIDAILARNGGGR